MVNAGLPQPEEHTMTIDAYTDDLMHSALALLSFTPNEEPTMGTPTSPTLETYLIEGVLCVPVPVDDAYQLAIDMGENRSACGLCPAHGPNMWETCRDCGDHTAYVPITYIPILAMRGAIWRE